MNGRLTLVLSSIMAATPIAIHTASAAPCSPPSSTSSSLLAKYKFLATTTNPILVAHRQTRGLPAVAANQVELVADTTTCRQAVDAYNNALAPDAATTTQLHVFRFGSTRYVVFDELRKAGEWIMSVVFSSNFAQIISHGSD